MDVQNDNRNLKLEVLSLLLFFVSLLFVILAVLATVLFIGSETLPELALTEAERARFGPYAFPIALGVLLVPAATIGLFLAGVRIFLVRRPAPDDSGSPLEARREPPKSEGPSP